MAAKSSDDETLRMPAVNETGADNGEAARSAQDSAHEPAEKTAGGAEPMLRQPGCQLRPALAAAS